MLWSVLCMWPPWPSLAAAWHRHFPQLCCDRCPQLGRGRGAVGLDQVISSLNGGFSLLSFFLSRMHCLICTSCFRKNVSASVAPLPEYPRPMLVRAAPTAHSTLSPQSLRDRGDQSNWISMNGFACTPSFSVSQLAFDKHSLFLCVRSLWEWEQDTSGGREPPFGKTLNQSILVPFPVESCLSGVAPTDSKSQVKSMW